MRRFFCGIILTALVSLPAAAAGFVMDTKFFAPPSGMTTVGDSHGDVAVSPAGEIYVSVQGGDHTGIQVYSAQGRYLRNVPGAPPDLHGFIIAQAPDRQFYIYGISRLAQEIIQLKLDGSRVLTIPASAIPSQYKKDDKQAIISPVSRWRPMATSMSPTAMAWISSIASTKAENISPLSAARAHRGISTSATRSRSTPALTL